MSAGLFAIPLFQNTAPLTARQGSALSPLSPTERGWAPELTWLLVTAFPDASFPAASQRYRDAPFLATFRSREGSVLGFPELARGVAGRGSYKADFRLRANWAMGANYNSPRAAVWVASCPFCKL